MRSAYSAPCSPVMRGLGVAGRSSGGAGVHKKVSKKVGQASGGRS